jgi:hypothetical protein
MITLKVGDTLTVKSDLPCWREARGKRHATIPFGQQIVILNSPPLSYTVRFSAAHEGHQESFSTLSSAIERCCRDVKSAVPKEVVMVFNDESLRTQLTGLLQQARAKDNAQRLVDNLGGVITQLSRHRLEEDADVAILSYLRIVKLLMEDPLPSWKSAERSLLMAIAFLPDEPPVVPKAD